MIKVDLWHIIMAIRWCQAGFINRLARLGKNMPTLGAAQKKKGLKTDPFPYELLPVGLGRLIIALLVWRFVAGVNFYNIAALQGAGLGFTGSHKKKTALN